MSQSRSGIGLGRVRLLIVDDHIIFRQAICRLLSRDPQIQVVGEAADGPHAIEATRSLIPDVVLMDQHLPILSGLEATRQLHEVAPFTRVLMLSAFGDEQYLFAAVQCGASGYVLKTAAVDFLLQAVHRVMSGEWVVDPEIEGQMKRLYPVRIDTTQPDDIGTDIRVPTRQRSQPEELMEALTPREREVLNLIARGMTNAEIGAVLGISTHTVVNHSYNLLAKLQVTTRLAAVMVGMRRRLVDVSDGKPVGHFLATTMPSTASHTE